MAKAPRVLRQTMALHARGNLFTAERFYNPRTPMGTWQPPSYDPASHTRQPEQPLSIEQQIDAMVAKG